MKRPLVRLSYRGVQERQTASDIDPNSFYTLRNELSPGNTLSSGSYRDANGTVNMTVAFAYSSSENWQFYYQKGRYFIRNYDYGSDWQLGLSEESRSVPTLMKRSGSLSQQWTLTREDGKTTLTNGLLGNGSWLALAEKNTVPGMQPSKTGAMWDIVLNYSAGKVQDQGMLVEISDIEVSFRDRLGDIGLTLAGTSVFEYLSEIIFINSLYYLTHIVNLSNIIISINNI